MPINVDTIRWPQRERLRYCEQKLYWTGTLRRSDLAATFKISTPAATIDFRLLVKIHGKGIRYNFEQKHYEPTRDFKPSFGRPDFGSTIEYLSRTQQGAAGGPFVARLNLPERKFSPEIGRAILRAIHCRESIGMDYTSVGDTEAKTDFRWIVPTAIGWDGSRYHVRAYCLRSKGYRDFVLGRIEKIIDHAPAPKDVPHDDEWDHLQDYPYVAAVNTSEAKEALAKEYGGMPVVIRERPAMKRYLDKNLEVMKLKPQN